MKKIMDWLENSFSPKMNRFVQNPWVAAISGSMMKILPVIMVGALIFSVLRNGMTILGIEAYWQQIVEGFVVILGVVIDMRKNARKA